MRTPNIPRAATVIVQVLLALTALLWASSYDGDSTVLTKAIGNGAAYEWMAPLWPGHGSLGYGSLSRSARRYISEGRFAALQNWADVCDAFAPVPAPGKGVPLSSAQLPPLPQGDGTVRSLEVIVAQEWSGWKLAKVSCSPPIG